MANIKSAKKRIKVSESKRKVNQARKSSLKTNIKKFDEALEENNTEKAQEVLKVVDKKLKQATHRNLIHKNAASRTLSKLTKRLNKAM